MERAVILLVVISLILIGGTLKVVGHRRNSVHSSGLFLGHLRNFASQQELENIDIDEILRMSEHQRFNSSQIQPRSGSAGDDSSCSQVKQRPPGGLRRILSTEAKEFYSKFTEAYRIPVMSHGSVPDAALKRACYVLRFLLADRNDLRQAFYSKWGRVVVLGKDEFVHDLPEFNFLKNYLDYESVAHLKTIPASDQFPIAIAPEENLLCHEAHHPIRRHHSRRNQQNQLKTQIDGDSFVDPNEESPPPRKHVDGKPLPTPRNMPDDIFLKSLSIGILNLAVKTLNPDLKHRLDRAYHHAMASDWWTNTESTFGPESYFGEGVQSFYDANAYSNPPDGFNNDINLRTKLRSYDTSLYLIVHQVFPCANSYQTRCSSRGNEAHLRFEMDCRIPHWQ